MLPIRWASRGLCSQPCVAALCAQPLEHAWSQAGVAQTACVHTSMEASAAHAGLLPPGTRSRVTKSQARSNAQQLRQLPATITGLEASEQQDPAYARSEAGLISRIAQASHHTTDGSRGDFIRTLRRHNTGLPALVGQVILGRILRMTKEHVYLDTGFHGMSEMRREDLDVSHVQVPSAHVPLSTRAGLSDIRVGDVLRVCVDSLYTPYGDMQLMPAKQDAGAQRRLLWRVLGAQKNAAEPVMGRLLNQCPGGYAVGVAGFVALLPYARAATETVQRVGTLERFFIDQMDSTQQTMTLVDARITSQQQMQAQQMRQQLSSTRSKALGATPALNLTPAPASNV